jgi:hypothetical protein
MQKTCQSLARKQKESSRKLLNRSKRDSPVEGGKNYTKILKLSQISSETASRYPKI